MRFLREEGIPYMVVTNNTKYASATFIEMLNARGYGIDKAHYLDPLMMLDTLIAHKNVAVYGNSDFLENMQALGYDLDFEKPTAVIVGLKPDYTNEDFAQMIEFLLKGAKLIGMHATTLYAKNSKRYPGTAAILEMLKTATSVPYTIVGKPSVPFYAQAKKMLEDVTHKTITYEDILMISDDVKGDLVGAKELGMRTLFVLSGKYRHADEILPKLPIHEHPDDIKAHLGEVLQHMQGVTR